MRLFAMIGLLLKIWHSTHGVRESSKGPLRSNSSNSFTIFFELIKVKIPTCFAWKKLHSKEKSSCQLFQENRMSAVHRRVRTESDQTVLEPVREDAEAPAVLMNFSLFSLVKGVQRGGGSLQ